MGILSELGIRLKKPVCISGLSESALRELVGALGIEVTDAEFATFVRSTSGVEVQFVFSPDGNFAGVQAKMNGGVVNLIPGTYSTALQVFQGAPSASNPGPGWKLEAELTKKYLNQPTNEVDWEIFYASRVNVVSP